MACSLKEGGKKCQSYLAKIAMDFYHRRYYHHNPCSIFRNEDQNIIKLEYNFLVFPMLII